jgi:two-component system, NarL family, sensor kinase
MSRVPCVSLITHDSSLMTRSSDSSAVLNAITEALHGSTDIHQALERTLSLVAGLLGLQTGWVWLRDPETSQFYVAATRRLPPYLQEPVRMAGSWCYCTDLFSRGKLQPTNIDMLECSRLHPAIHAQDPSLTGGLRYHASIPLYFRDRGLGIMNIAGPSWRALDDRELRLLSTIASQIAIAVERGRLTDEGTRLERAEERARLAREIHDGLAQGLTAIGLDIEGALRHVDDQPEQARERLRRALDTTREALEQARASVLNLRAEPLAERSLPEAIAALARRFTSETGILIQTNVDSAIAFPLRIESEVYRIAQEALANVRLHAHATEASIRLKTERGYLVLSVRDNGVGMDAEAASNPPPGHHGLVGMRERARLLGGHLRVSSRPGSGTTVTARIPVPAEPR